MTAKSAMSSGHAAKSLNKTRNLRIKNPLLRNLLRAKYAKAGFIFKF